MSISEYILLFLSRNLSSADYFQEDVGAFVGDDALKFLTYVYPDFSAIVSGKRVVDFGCGVGNQSIALAKKYGCSVVGVDSNKKILMKAIENAKSQNIAPGKLHFVEGIFPDMRNSFDVVISQDSFEHFTYPEKVLDEMVSLLTNSGIILITFGPPWLAPYGSHMHFFCKFPWINILFSEEVVMKVRSRFRSDGAKKYEEVESGLNKMTIAKFESIVASCGLRMTYRKYECVKGINWLSRVPLLREFFINQATVILSKAV